MRECVNAKMNLNAIFTFIHSDILAFTHSKPKGKGHLDRVGEMISEELARRRQAG